MITVYDKGTRLDEKLNRVYDLLKGKRVVVAFSGGVDSSLVLFLAKQKSEKVIAVTADSVTLPLGEIEEAKEFVKKNNVKHIMIKVNELSDPNFAANPSNRCYYCKKHLLEELKEIAQTEECDMVVDGTNASDMDDYRPGIQALREYDIISPLALAGITKKEVRLLASKLGLEDIAEKPSSPCLSSRIPYGQEITEEKLFRIGEAEKFIKKVSGIKILRVRDHDGLARIEVGKNEIEKIFNVDLLESITKELKQLGFVYICVDAEGYRTGALNETISKHSHQTTCS